MLLATKTTLPPRSDEYIQRQRLFQKVAALPDARLILACAPAGFGKSSWLIAHAHRLRADGARVVWYALDKTDNDPVRFAAYLYRAFRSAGGPSQDDPAEDDEIHSLEEVVTLILNQLVADEGRYVFVLDDYHLINNPAIHNAIGLMLDHLPANAQLAIGSRADPPLRLSRLRACRQIVELRAADLRFSTEEIKAFAAHAPAASLSSDSIRALENASEGWITALWLIRLAASSAAQPLDDAAIAQHLGRFSTAQRHIFDYFADEVFDQQPPELQQFLLDTCVLNQLSPAICRALTGDPGAPQLLDQTARRGLFLISLSDREPLYRYHHLFEEFLRNRLKLTEPGRFRALHREAWNWHQAHGSIVDAVNHALSAQATDDAARLIMDRAWEALAAHGEIMTVLSWLPAFPEAALRAHPRLCLYFSRALYLTGDFERSSQYVQIAADTVEQQSATDGEHAATRAIVANYQATLAAYQGELARGLAFIEQAMPHFQALDEVSQVRVANTKAYLRFLQGDVAAARGAYQEALARAIEADHAYLTIDAVYFLAQLDLMAGQLRQAQTRCETYLDQQARRIAPVSALLSVLAQVRYAQNRPVEAESLLREAIELAQRGNISEVLWLACTRLAVYLAAQGQSEEAAQFARRADTVAAGFDSPPIHSFVGAAKTRMALSLQQLDDAIRWAENYQQSGPVEYVRDYEDLTLARVRLAQDRPQDALPQLDTVIDHATQGGRTGTVLEAQMLRALAFEAAGSRDRARQALEIALELAAPEGIVRLFLDAGPALAQLLRHTREQSTVAAYAGLLLRETQNESRQVHPSDALTDREREVLQLVAQGATNQDIADTLVISLGTVKSHVSHIMNKLNAQNRTEAVTTAQALGILDA